MICSDFGCKPLFLAVLGESYPGSSLSRGGGEGGRGGGGGGQKSKKNLAKNKTNPQPSFRPFCPHQKVFCGVLQRYNYPSIVIWQSFRPMIVYSCVFHPTILRRSLTIIFSQREGSSHLASIKAHSLSNSQPWTIVVQFWRKKGRSLNLSVLISNLEEICEDKSWRKIWRKMRGKMWI